MSRICASAAWQNGTRGLTIAVFRQPGANVIDAVDRVKAALPRLQAVVPPAVEIQILTDRTKTIRASVDDVEFTLVITVCLVVMVIFLFLRNFWATVIPGVTVPLSIIGTFAVMYLLGYSLDNLSLMALTIAVGFVVDDAIVMIENIVRHLEDGDGTASRPPSRAPREIGFTIISISCSLIAVFIPLLLMGGIIGRLFHEFAITVTATIAVSAIVSLTLTPMMCARFLKDEKHASHGRFYRADGELLRRHAAISMPPGCAGCCATSSLTLDGADGDDRQHRRTLCRHSQGLLPAAGHRHHLGHLGSRPGCLVPEHGAQRKRPSPTSSGAIPMSTSFTMYVGQAGSPQQ